MLSPKCVAQPNPSYPAFCRQDTTFPCSTDYGGLEKRKKKHIFQEKHRKRENTGKMKKKEKYMKKGEKKKRGLKRSTPRDG